MGIKFHCPQGHKLNVKSFLAGKKGVCPKCGTRVRIPTASEPGLDDGAGDDDSDGGKPEAGPAGNGSAKAGGSQAVATVALPSALPTPATQPVMPVAAPTLPIPATRLPEMPAAPQGVGDPIAEAPGAIWYVRPPSGGQFGPARGDVMRKWIAEGRVSSDSLVWREGWSDWQTAGKLFPNLQSAAAPAAIAPPAGGVTRATRTASRNQSKQAGGGLGVGLLIFLAFVCVALVAVLAYVLFNMNA